MTWGRSHDTDGVAYAPSCAGRLPVAKQAPAGETAV
jgi:hypothetical protein